MDYFHPRRFNRVLREAWLRTIMYHFPQHWADYRFKKTFGRGIDWRHPRDLNEWINYLAFKTDITQWSRLADKYEVRNYVKEKGLGEILLTNYGKWETPDEINFDILPERFVIKTNCSCGDSIIVNSKTEADYDAIKDRLRQSLEKRDNIFRYSGEPHYLRIKQLIICEQLVPLLYSNDYKVWCFNGRPFGVLTCSNRDASMHHLDLAMYDLNWNRHDEWIAESYRNDVKVRRPVYFEKMIECAKILSEGFPQVRIDFYDTPEQVYFGEMTFTSACGRMEYYTPEVLTIMGELVTRGK